jgi:uncharacterized membrane protein
LASLFPSAALFTVLLAPDHILSGNGVILMLDGSCSLLGYRSSILLLLMWSRIVTIVLLIIVGMMRV